MPQLLQVVFPSRWWQSGVDSDNNPLYTFIDLGALATACTSVLDIPSVVDTNGAQYGANSFQEPVIVELVTSNVPGLKSAINGYLAGLNAPSANYPIYPIAIDVTLGP